MILCSSGLISSATAMDPKSTADPRSSPSECLLRGRDRRHAESRTHRHRRDRERQVVQRCCRSARRAVRRERSNASCYFSRSGFGVAGLDVDTTGQDWLSAGDVEPVLQLARSLPWRARAERRRRRWSPRRTRGPHRRGDGHSRRSQVTLPVGRLLPWGASRWTSFSGRKR